MAGATPPAKKAAPRKRAAKKTAPLAAQPPAGRPAAPASAPAEASGGQAVNQWLHGLVDTPVRIEVFDRWWEFKRSTGGRAEAWDVLRRSPGGIRAALASMMFDPTPAGDGDMAGSARADEFLELAYHWVPADADVAAEFWERMQAAIFDPGGASAS